MLPSVSLIMLSLVSFLLTLKLLKCFCCFLCLSPSLFPRVSDVGTGLSIVFGILGCLYCCKQLCPGGIQFSSLDLDEIRLERLDDVERAIQQDIQKLTSKLQFHREKKMQIQNKQDFRIPAKDFIDDETDALLGNEMVDVESPMNK
jgi:hypothetical protein